MHEESKKIRDQLGLLNAANPLEFAAEEYLCTHILLDNENVPHFDGDKKLSLMGRIRKYVDREKLLMMGRELH